MPPSSTNVFLRKSCPALQAAARVLVVDDSALMRQMIADMLRDAGLDVVGTARDGLDALDKTRTLRPDVLTLDIEMPRMDGVAFLDALMRDSPTPVVMLTGHGADDADLAVRCLELGAFDCLRKPSGTVSYDIEQIRTELVATVRAAADTPRDRLRPPESRSCPNAESLGSGSRSGPSVSSTSQKGPISSAHRGNLSVLGNGSAGCSNGVNARRSRNASIHTSLADLSPSRVPPVIIIAASTGGPAALSRLLPRLPARLNAAVIVIQHLPAGFTGALAARLSRLCHNLEAVREAADGDALRPGLALIAPAGRHLAFDDAGNVVTCDEPALWGVRPAADITFGSAAERFGPRAVGVILTGMGRDGAMGARKLRDSGGFCVAQDESSSVVFGMPRAAYESGAVDCVAPLEQIADRIAEAVERLAA